MVLTKVAKSEFSSFRTFFQENESAININIQVSVGYIKRVATSQISEKLDNVQFSANDVIV